VTRASALSFSVFHVLGGQVHVLVMYVGEMSLYGAIRQMELPRDADPAPDEATEES
jgi:hypothetical protein